MDGLDVGLLDGNNVGLNADTPYKYMANLIKRINLRKLIVWKNLG